MKRLVVAILAALMCTGCVPAADYVPDRDDIYAPLHNGDLSEFDYRLSLDEHAGRDDAFTHLGRALFDLVTCRPLPEQPPGDIGDEPEANLAYALARLEQQRRNRLIRQYLETSDGPWHHYTVHSRISVPEFFDTSAAPPEGDLIRWPDHGEGWPDEWPAAVDVENHCAGQLYQPRNDDLPEPFDELDGSSVTAHLIDEWLQTRRVDLAIDDLDDDAPLRDRGVEQIAAHRADLLIALRADSQAMAVGEGDLDDSTREVIGELLDAGGDQPPFELALRTGWLAMAVDDADTAVDAFLRLTDHPDDTVSDVARYYAVKLAWLDGDYERTADIATDTIDGPDSLRSAYAYFAASAHRQMGNDDQFLGIARDTLRNRRRDSDDPFAGALYRQVLRQLVRYDVDDRIPELLEEFGPRSELDTRTRELAEVAVDMGRPGVAEQLVEPLLEENRDARRLPRYHATLALAAFLRDDREQFDHHVEQLLHRPERLMQVIPQRRQASFFAHYDTELARVLRATLPLMAQWGDDPGARAMRQQWLEALVEYTRTFLQTVPSSAVSDDLADLYRLAGQLLEEHPRGYAERVGEEKPSASALVLGTVDMPPTPPLDQAPRPALRWPAVHSLLLIPRGGVPPQQFTHDLKPHRDDDS